MNKGKVKKTQGIQNLKNTLGHNSPLNNNVTQVLNITGDLNLTVWPQKGFFVFHEGCSLQVTITTLKRHGI